MVMLMNHRVVTSIAQPEKCLICEYLKDDGGICNILGKKPTKPCNNWKMATLESKEDYQ